MNGKVYVGQTIHGDKPNKRWSNGNKYKNNPYFWSAIQKYGWDNFEHEVIASRLTKKEACNFEKLLISKLNTYNRKFGYNLTLGGEGSHGRFPTEETKRKISEALKGRKLSIETKEKIGMASAGRNIGRKHTEEELKKMREKRSLSKRDYTKRHNNYKCSEETKKKIQESSHKKAVLQKDINGNILNKYNSLSSASRKTGINLGNISSCCNNRVRTAGGFVWCFD